MEFWGRGEGKRGCVCPPRLSLRPSLLTARSQGMLSLRSTHSVRLSEVAQSGRLPLTATSRDQQLPADR
eukprot:4755706-Amphidinium_carterae.1